MSPITTEFLEMPMYPSTVLLFLKVGHGHLQLQEVHGAFYR